MFSRKRGPCIVFVHPGTVYNVFSVCVRVFVPLSAPCGVRVRHPYVFSGTQNCTLSCSVCVFAVWRACKAPSRNQWYPKTALSRVQCVFFVCFCCRPHTRPRVSEKQKKPPLIHIYMQKDIKLAVDTHVCGAHQYFHKLVN